jgi:hypothetical protein
MHATCSILELGSDKFNLSTLKLVFEQSTILCGFDLALARPLYYNRLVQLASTIKFVHHKLWFKGVELSKDGILARASAIERTTLEPKGHDQAHTLSAREVRVALAAIANLLASWDFRAVICDRSHTSRSNALGSNTQHTIERTWA